MTYSIDSLNSWLNETGLYGGTYDTATYISGDFNASVKYAKEITKNFNVFQYDMFNRNCLHTSWECLMKGTTYYGVPFSEIYESDIGWIPSEAQEIVAGYFENTNYTFASYWLTINNKYNNAVSERNDNMIAKLNRLSYNRLLSDREKLKNQREMLRKIFSYIMEKVS